MEQLKALKDIVNWGPFIWGSIAGLAPWIAIGSYRVATGNYGQVPWFVGVNCYCILYSIQYIPHQYDSAIQTSW